MAVRRIPARDAAQPKARGERSHRRRHVAARTRRSRRRSGSRRMRRVESSTPAAPAGRRRCTPCAGPAKRRGGARATRLAVVRRQPWTVEVEADKSVRYAGRFEHRDVEAHRPTRRGTRRRGRRCARAPAPSLAGGPRRVVARPHCSARDLQRRISRRALNSGGAPARDARDGVRPARRARMRERSTAPPKIGGRSRSRGCGA